jgi:hypothetical protein
LPYLHKVSQGYVQPYTHHETNIRKASLPATVFGQYGYNDDHVQRAFEAPPNVPHESITDPELWQEGMFASKKLKATLEDRERLDPSMIQRSSPLN